MAVVSTRGIADETRAHRVVAEIARVRAMSMPAR
jgi:hypothetical protein